MLIVYKSIYFLYPSPCSADGSELNLTHACRVFPSPTLGLSHPLLALPGGAGLWGILFVLNGCQDSTWLL